MGRTTIIGPISSMRRLKTGLRQGVGDIEKSERRAGHAFDRDNACHVCFCRRNDAPAGPGPFSVPV
jgi:hypothetical protein